MTDNSILTLTAGAMSIELWTTGARLNAATWNGHGNLLDGSRTLDDALGPKLNHGSVAGPVANRIAGGTADIDGLRHNFERNENNKTLLHSGSNSTRDAEWAVEEQSDTSATLSLAIARMSDGFPGNRVINARYDVFENGFDLTFTASTDRTTLMNLALHPYWSLGTDRAGLRLKVNSDRYLPVNADTIPIGEIVDVSGTHFDLRNLDAPSFEIDHNYCLGQDGAMAEIATLASDKVTLVIESDAPGLQIFTGKSFGIAIEPQHWPDAPHHPNFPSIQLDPGQTYSQTSRYRFSAT
ncbi:galactose mutarotase [Rhodobacteraceae bacterium]|nr:galactose mutarotase [Paracoccaceae bacterium]